MSALKPDYKIMAEGNIRLKAVEDRKMKKLLADHKRVIDEIWSRTLKREGDKVFNGTLLNFSSVERDDCQVEVRGNFVEYKHFVAQRESPDLNFGIKPIGVSGLMTLREKGGEYVVFARRSHEVDLYPGFYELVPSGGIDKGAATVDGTINYEFKLLTEFVEETGLSSDWVQGISGFVLVSDERSHLYDIGCRMTVDVKRSVFEKSFHSKEYAPPEFIDVKEIDGFIEQNINSIVPTSAALAKKDFGNR